MILGDDWIFHIRVLNIIEVKESFEPRIIKSKGYISQYPDYDDWYE